MSINALTEMSRRYGKNIEYVIAGGGNTSYKENGAMYVKCSGTPLAQITEDDFVAMDLSALRSTLKTEYRRGMPPAQADVKPYEAIMAARLPGQEGKRPSVESALHALFPYKFVLHLHPAIVNGLTCSVNFESTCERLFGREAGGAYNAVWIRAMPPGPELAGECKGVFDAAAPIFPQIVFLQNHGIFTAADTTGEIDDIMTYVIEKLTSVIEKFPALPDTVSANPVTFPLTPEQVLYPDNGLIQKNAVKITAYAKAFGGASPLPEDIVNALGESDLYGKSLFTPQKGQIR